MPSGNAIAKGVVITAISLVIINFVKPYMPEPVRGLLG